MDIKATIVNNWPVVLGGAIGLYVVYKYVYSGSSSTASQSSGQVSGPTAAQLQYQSASNVLAAQTASDQLHADVAMMQIAANRETAMYSTSVGGTVAMAQIQGKSFDLQNTLSAKLASDNLYVGADIAKATISAKTQSDIAIMQQQTANFQIATVGAVELTKAKGAVDIGLTNAQGQAIQNIILANNQVPLATIAASSLANVSAINSARDISIADINSQTNLMYAQAKVIEAQSLEPIQYIKSSADVQMSYNANQPKLMSPFVTPPTTAPAPAYTPSKYVDPYAGKTFAPTNYGQSGYTSGVSPSGYAGAFGMDLSTMQST